MGEKQKKYLNRNYPEVHIFVETIGSFFKSHKYYSTVKTSPESKILTLLFEEL